MPRWVPDSAGSTLPFVAEADGGVPAPASPTQNETGHLEPGFVLE